MVKHTQTINILIMKNSLEIEKHTFQERELFPWSNKKN